MVVIAKLVVAAFLYSIAAIFGVAIYLFVEEKDYTGAVAALPLCLAFFYLGCKVAISAIEAAGRDTER